MIFGGRSFSGKERHCVFLNTGSGEDRGPQFARISAVSGLDLADDGRAIALVDWDFDGDLDVWISNRNAPRLRFMRNDAPSSNHFLALRLEGNGSTTNRNAIGARVEVHLSLNGQKPLIRSLRAGEGFLGQSSKWLHFGLGSAEEVEKVVVKWPAGDAEIFLDLQVDTRYHLVQGSAVATVWTPPQRTLAITPSTPQVTPPSSVARVPLAYRLPMVHVPYRDFDGSQKWVRFDSGKPMLINLWASWCRPCLSELKEMTDRSEEIRTAGIDVLALSVDGLNGDGLSDEAAKAIISGLKFPFPAAAATPQLLDTFQAMHDRQIPMRRPLPLPTSFLIDARGDLAVIYKGPFSVDQLLEDAHQSREASRQRFASASPFAGRTIDDPRIERLRRRVETLIAFRLGMSIERAGRLKEATTHYRSVLRLEPDYAEAHNNLGIALARSKLFIDAETSLRRAVELKPTFDLAHHNLANVLLQLGRAPEAIAHYRKAVQLNPKHAGYHYSLGSARLHQQDYQPAVVNLRQAIELDGRFADAHNNLGLALEKLGQHSEALQHYLLALKINHRHALAAANIVRLRKTPRSRQP